MKKSNYFNLSGNAILDKQSLLNLKGGFDVNYGCQSNVCSVNRSGAKDLCTDAYCRSGVGPVKPQQPGKPKETCILFINW